MTVLSRVQPRTCFGDSPLAFFQGLSDFMCSCLLLYKPLATVGTMLKITHKIIGLFADDDFTVEL